MSSFQRVPARKIMFLLKANHLKKESSMFLAPLFCIRRNCYKIKFCLHVGLSQQTQYNTSTKYNLHLALSTLTAIEKTAGKGMLSNVNVCPGV